MSPPSAWHSLTGVGMIAVAAISVILWKRGRMASWAAFGLGALAWVAGVASKVAWAVPVNPLVFKGLHAALPPRLADPLFWLYVGLLTGVFECRSALLFVRRTRLRSAGWDEAVAFGIGFGAVEALLMGLSLFLIPLIVILFWDQLPADVKENLADFPEGGLAATLLPVAERVSAVIGHTFACVLIVFGVRSGARRWFWLAFAFKTASDTLGAWASLNDNTRSVKGWFMFELAIGLSVVAALFALAYLKRRFHSRAAAESTPTA
jgi:uncharacterized membrane protein YhfC